LATEARRRDGAWWSQTFDNDGGPLIALPHELVGHWPGARSDYDRACDARRPFDLLPAGPGLVVVAGSTDTMLYAANWLRVDGQPGVMLVGWDSGAADERQWLLSKLAAPGVAWQRHRPLMEVASGVLLLQHAAGPAADVRLAPADRGACIGQVVPVGVAPGRYALESVAFDEKAGGERYCCVVCRWVPARQAEPSATPDRAGVLLPGCSTLTAPARRVSL
jgi:hypothetical protein